VTLKDVKELSNPGAPLKDQHFIASTNIESWNAGSADTRVPNGETFRTDSDITKTNALRRDRELQAWQPTPDPIVPQSDEPPAPLPQLGQGDDVTFGPGAKNTQWDQFAVNEKLFGVKTNFDEDVYTTRLDRSAADFKERERKAQKIANEITGVVTNNPHVAEERTVNIVDDSGMDEEDKYGAVVRGSNAYVPPGARKQSVNAATPANAPKTEIPKVSVNAPDGAVISPPQVQSPQSSSKSPSPAPTNSNKPPADALPAFRDFVTNEKQRLSLKRQALVKSDMDKRMAELVKFSQSFKVRITHPFTFRCCR
jgi:PAB1-binding protein PBP1